MQCAKHNVGHIFISSFFVQMSPYMTADVRYLNPLYAIMYQIGCHFYIVNVEDTLSLPLQ